MAPTASVGEELLTARFASPGLVLLTVWNFPGHFQKPLMRATLFLSQRNQAAELAEPVNRPRLRSFR